MLGTQYTENNIATQTVNGITLMEMSTGSILPWDRIVAMAESYYFSQKNLGSEVNASSMASPVFNPGSSNLGAMALPIYTQGQSFNKFTANKNIPVSKSQEFSGGSSSPKGNKKKTRNKKSVESQIPMCQFCGRRGHTFEKCFLAQGKTKLESLVFICPFCNGPHLGMNCDNKPNGNQGNE